MNTVKRRWFTSAALVAGAALGIASFRADPTAAQDMARADVGTVARRSIATQVVTLKFEDQRGEPKAVSGTARFDRNVEVYWISVTGVDVKFRGSTEKQINRVIHQVDPIAKVNGKTVEVSGKLGARDGSGIWDDTYEGTITVAVTAVLADQ